MAIGMDKEIQTALFLADEAARYSVKPECLAPRLRSQRTIIEEMQGSDDATCPTPYGGEFSVKALVACGMRVYGCHLCIAKAIHPKCGSLIDEFGVVDPEVWDRAVLEDVRPIYEPGTPDQMDFFEMPYSDRLVGQEDQPPCECTGVDAAVLSF
jgi:hypothetical protein